MEWFYVKDGKQNGPVDLAALVRLRDAGEVTGDTLIWREGLEGWQPLREVGEVPGKPVRGEAPAPAAEKDAVPVLPSSTPSPAANEFFDEELEEDFLADPSELIRSDYAVDVGHCIGRAWDLMKQDFWPVVGISAVVLIAYSAVGNVPVLGGLASLALAAPFFAGLYYYYLVKIRGGRAGFEDAFSGFTRNFPQLILLSVVTTLIILASLVPGALAIVGGAIMMNNSGANVVEAPPVLLMCVGGLVAVIPAAYLHVSWMFSYFLCIDKRIDFWPAMQVSMKTVRSQWFSCFIFVLAMMLLSALGVIALCVGILVTMPLGMIATTYFYEDLFGKKPARGSKTA